MATALSSVTSMSTLPLAADEGGDGPRMALSRTANASRAWTSAARRDMARVDVSKLAELRAQRAIRWDRMPAGLDLTPP